MTKGYKIRPEILICLFLVISTLVVYWPVNNYEFVGYDDDRYITQNVQVKKGLGLDNIIWAFKTTTVSNWHPLTWLSHMLDVEFYGMNSGSHHMTSVLFHILNSFLLFFVFVRMTSNLWQSGFVAALFALHPLHVESVAWVAERKDVLSTFFWMLTMFSYARYAAHPGISRYLPVVGFFMLGLMAKPMLVTLPFVLLLLDYWPLRRMQFNSSADDRHSWQRRSPGLLLIWEKIPLFLLALVSSVVTFLAQKSGGAVGSMEIYPLATRVSNALVAYVKYIGKMIWPANLAVFYPYSGSLPAWQVIGAGVLLGFITFVAIRFFRQHPWFVVGWLWFVGTLVPVIGLVQVGLQAMADRYTYIPLIGLFVIVAWGVPQLMLRWRQKTKLIASSAVALLIILSVTSGLQMRYWKNSVTLFKHALDVTNDNYIIHNNLGFTLTAQGRPNDAINHYKDALRINPDFELANINLGIALLSQGKLDQSINYYQNVLKEKPGYAGVRHNLGIVLLRKGKIDEAVFHLREALRLKPDYAEAYNSLGAAMVFKGEIEDAIRIFRKALQIKPGYLEPQKNLDKLLAAEWKKQKIN